MKNLTQEIKKIGDKRYKKTNGFALKSTSASRKKSMRGELKNFSKKTQITKI